MQCPEQIEGVVPGGRSILVDVYAALEAAGNMFVRTPADGPGVQFGQLSHGAG